MGDNPGPGFADETKDQASKAIYISVGVSVVLILIIAFLLFCLFSKRDLSPCPAESNFGKRYSQIRTRIRTTVRGRG